MCDKKIGFSIDRGGTFTDIYYEVFDVKDRKTVIKSSVCKLLSEDPSNYRDAPTEGIRRILELETGVPHPRTQVVDTSRIEYIRMGTTVATNALLERKGERIALLTTKGFKDLQRIGNQSRPKIFDLEIRRPDLLFENVFEVDERVVLQKDALPVDCCEEVYHGTSGELLRVEKGLNREEISSILERIQQDGIQSIAVCFLHSYIFPKHEEEVKDIAIKMGFKQISISSEVMPMV